MLFSEFLVNENLPEDYRFKGPITKKVLGEKLTQLAKDHPDLYPDIVKNIKHVGDMFATFEGVSVGLDDITPHYKERKALFAEARSKIKGAKDRQGIIEALVDTQNKALSILGDQEGSLHRQVSSGSRGKPGQLLKTVFSPVVAKGRGDIAQPYLIEHSYAEGLTPGAFWLTAGESRRELATTQTATALPGDTSKQISSTLNSVTVSKADCGTKNGLEYDIDDHHLYDRYEARTNRLITPSHVKSLKSEGKKSLIVRSPMTCLENPGVCQKCYGKNTFGEHHDVGTHIGLRAAQALSEPLTQMVLSSKHGGFMAHAGETKLRGTLGFRQLVDMPSVFKDEAILSESEGHVDAVRESPQGGNEIVVSGNSYYSNPRRNVSVGVGDKIRMGQSLTDGIPNPKDVVRLRGMGEGRKYMADTIHNIYRDSGVDIDKRHVEILVKQDLNHIKVLNGLAKGETVTYNHFRENLEDRAEKRKVSDSLLGKQLAQDFLHFTVGTTINDELLKKMQKSGLKRVSVTNEVKFEPIVRPLEQIPLLSQDWVARLAHRRLKDTLLEGAAQGWDSKTTGPSPYPKILYGKNK